MNISTLIFFYLFSASIIFLHGIGLERLSINARSKQAIISFIIKNAGCMFVAASISRLVISYLLSPIQLHIFAPFFIVLISYLCEYVTQSFFIKETKSRIQEHLFSYGTVLFALYYTITYAELVLVLLIACFSMLFWSLVLYTVTFRMNENMTTEQWKQGPLLLISMGVITLALSAWDNAWFLIHF